MPSFQCSACGAPYHDSGNFSSCPTCGGMGLAEEGCTCKCLRVGFGLRTGCRITKNPACPVHGINGTKPDPENMYAPDAPS